MDGDDNFSDASRVTRLVLDVFALNNRLLTTGDRLVEGLGLTSARWQLLGTVIENERHRPVAWIARDMSANRQNIQRIVNDLVSDDFLRFEPNPHHRRAQLVVPTDKGRSAYSAALRLQVPWVADLANGISSDEITTAHRVIMMLRARLEANDAEERT